jgi:hypothetical protein
MTSPSHEHLLGFVLGALEPQEHEQLEREMAKDPRLARQAEVLAARLQPLEALRETEPPPEGLAARCCSMIFEQMPPEQPTVSPARRGVAAAMSADYSLAGSGRGSSWTLTDMVVAAGIFIAAGMLFFPAIANSRSQAQVAQCQNNLRQYGESVARFENAHPDYNLNVSVMPNHLAAAGIQPVLVKDMGFLDRDSVLVCPGSPEVAQRNNFSIPSLREFNQASPTQLEALTRRAAGSTAFSLGYVPQPNVKQVHSSDYQAVASDAPMGMLPHMVSSHHDGKGQNVLFKSGRVAYVCGCGDQDCGGDSLFWNHNLKIEAGVHEGDNVLAIGGTRPFATPVSFPNNN